MNVLLSVSPLIVCCSTVNDRAGMDSSWKGCWDGQEGSAGCCTDTGPPQEGSAGLRLWQDYSGNPGRKVPGSPGPLGSSWDMERDGNCADRSNASYERPPWPGRREPDCPELCVSASCVGSGTSF